MKKRVQIAIGTLGILLLVVAFSEYAQMLPLDTVSGNAEYLSKGTELMSLMGIGENVSAATVSSWCFPTSIVVNARTYRVEHSMDTDSGTFDIYSPDNSERSIASGDVVRKRNAHLARLNPFVDLAAECSVPLYNLSQIYALTPLDSLTNAFYFSCKTNYPSSRIYLVYKNIAMLMRFSNSEQDVATNKLTFVVTLMNAGLPENDRVPLTGNGGAQTP